MLSQFFSLFFHKMRREFFVFSTQQKDFPGSRLLFIYGKWGRFFSMRKISTLTIITMRINWNLNFHISCDTILKWKGELKCWQLSFFSRWGKWVRDFACLLLFVKKLNCSLLLFWLCIIQGFESIFIARDKLFKNHDLNLKAEIFLIEINFSSSIHLFPFFLINNF